MLILGLSCFFHDAAAAVLVNGKLVAAAQEERFTRIKFDPSFPINAIRYCLAAAGATPRDLDCVAYFENPKAKFQRLLAESIDGSLSLRRSARKSHIIPGPERVIRLKLRYDLPIKTYSHHLSHAAYSFTASGYPASAVLVADTVGEWRSTSLIEATETGLKEFFGIDFPDSLGVFYSAITSFLGFRVNSDEYKIMGLAPYGRANRVCQLEKLLRLQDDGGYSLDPLFLDLSKNMFGPALAELLHLDCRKSKTELTQDHADVAKSAQVLLERALLGLATRAKRESGLDSLCMGGGIALNCAANTNIRKQAGFRRVFVPPGAGDAGSAVGAAMLAHHELMSSWPNLQQFSAHLGPSFSSLQSAQCLSEMHLPFRTISEVDLPAVVARLLATGNIIGWFQGRMEFGPRALGSRSILADARRPEMRSRLNSLVKKREEFRPFAPIALSSRAHMLFEKDDDDPFMTFLADAKLPTQVQSAVHVDGTSRLQTLPDKPATRLTRLLEAFETETGTPTLLNTSFNLSDEPIVCSPLDAILCFRESGIDALVLENHLVLREECNANLLTRGAFMYLEYSRELRPHISSTYSFV